MIYSNGRKATGGGRRTTRIRIVVVSLIVLATAALVAVGLLGVFDAFPFGISRRDSVLIDAWSGGDYVEVIRAAEETLSSRPLDGQALAYGGFAYFYHGIDLVDAVEQEAHLVRSIQLLRKAEHVTRSPLAQQRDYVLGKAYYHRGLPYADLSAFYLERALEAGYDADDTRQYLGLAYADLGQYETSAEWFIDALDRADTREEADSLRINAAESLTAMGEYDTAERYLLQVVTGTDDPYIELIGRNRLASVLILKRELGAAEDLIEETIRDYPGSADAYYYLGIVYDETDRAIEARAAWRSARDLDPEHFGALTRLANGGE
jgi:tetratricopeptide (TPR) repeat protein